MRQYKPKEVFSNVTLGENRDPHVFYRTIYTCPCCGQQVAFKEDDFLRHELQKSLDFECPECGSNTRVGFDVGYGGKFSIVCINTVFVEYKVAEGSPEMKGYEELLWEILKSFDYLKTEFGYKTESFKAVWYGVTVTFRKRGRRIVVYDELEFGKNGITFTVKGRFKTILKLVEETTDSVQRYADYIRDHYSNCL